MANVNAPFGLKPIRYASGAPYNGACNEYFATGATGAIFIGDPVVAAGSANSAMVQGRQIGSLPTVTVGLDGDGDPILGVCVGVIPVTRDSSRYREDSTDRIILVADDPDLVFIGQCDTAGTDWAVGDSGAFGNMLVGSGNTATGTSGWTLDTTDGPDNADPSNQLRIIRVHPRVDNEIGEYAIWEVMINNHALANVADGGRFTGV
jgi:hypothetical protein